MKTIKALISWCHGEHGVPLEVPTAWNGSGVGYHVQFAGRWDKRGATSPGPVKRPSYRAASL